MKIFKAIFTGKWLIAISFLVLICFLSVVIGVIANSPESATSGYITAENYTPVRETFYSIEVQNEFKVGIKEFIMDFLGIKDISIISIEGAASLLTCFRQAGISGEKALSFSRYVRNIVDPDDVMDLENANTKEDLKGIFALLAFFSDVEVHVDELTGKEIKTLIFNPEKYILNIFSVGMYSNAITAITDNTMLTFDEIARLAYEILLSDNSEGRGILPREDFVTVFRSFIYLGTIVADFRNNGGTMTQARLISELIYQSGSEMSAILDARGIDSIMEYFGFSSPLPSLAFDPKYSDIVEGTEWFEAISKLEDVRELVQRGEEIARFFFFMSINSMINIENLGLEGIARAQAEGTENPDIYLYLSMISLSRSLTSGLEVAYSENDTIKTKEILSDELSLLLVEAKSIDKPFENELDMQNFRENTRTQLTSFLVTIQDVFSEYGNIDSVKQMEELSAEEVEILKGYYTIFTENGDTYYDSFNSLLSTVFVNTALNMYLKAYDLMIGVD